MVSQKFFGISQSANLRRTLFVFYKSVIFFVMKFKNRKILKEEKIGMLDSGIMFICRSLHHTCQSFGKIQGKQTRESLDAQIKAYRKSAIENMRVFGRMEKGPYPLPRSNQGIIKQWHQENPKEPSFTKENSVQTKKKKSEDNIPKNKKIKCLQVGDLIIENNISQSNKRIGEVVFIREGRRRKIQLLQLNNHDLSPVSNFDESRLKFLLYLNMNAKFWIGRNMHAHPNSYLDK